jgi:hypothetical protein
VVLTHALTLALVALRFPTIARTSFLLAMGLDDVKLPISDQDLGD